MTDPIDPTTLPRTRTTEQLREMIGADDEVAQAMIDSALEQPGGTIVGFRLNRGGQVGYLHDGDDLWHRDDTKIAKLLQQDAARRARKSGATSDTEEAADGS
jgi:hypothetical protein